MKQQENQALKEINVYDTKLDNQTPTHTTTYINIILKKKQITSDFFRAPDHKQKTNNNAIWITKQGK